MKKLSPGIQIAERSATATQRRSSSFAQPHASVMNMSPESLHYDGHSLARSVL